ncbi:hypothetical protein RJ641_012406 [Dillenia turbinata]|uniref:Uncharacterized protein n=1 Tax=Dillenia turbinata TaxID=194707 RepID=A0AAN8Z0H6_9MAGN
MEILLLIYARFQSSLLYKRLKMGRGVSSGGGQSSLGYLFGSGEAPSNNAKAASNDAQPVKLDTSPKEAAVPSKVDVTKQIPAGINSTSASGQNTGNFITAISGQQRESIGVSGEHSLVLGQILDRPSTKVHSAPGGGSSLGYLFGGGGSK